MVRLRQQVVRCVRALAVAAAPAAAAAGCATFHGLSKDFHELSRDLHDMVPASAETPASQVACAWQNRIVSLPDPLRNGAPTPGIAGQIFLYDASYQPIEAAGELTVSLSDATPRPPGMAGPTSEVWHFTNSTLRKLRLVDERMGKCYVIFLPWSETWKDVSRVRFQVRYDQPNGTTLYSQEAEVQLDFTPGPNGVIPGMGGGGAVPNPADLLKQARVAQTAGRKFSSGGTPMPPAGVQPAGYPPMGPGMAVPPQGGGYWVPNGQPGPGYPPQGYPPPAVGTGYAPVGVPPQGYAMPPGNNYPAPPVQPSAPVVPMGGTYPSPVHPAAGAPPGGNPQAVAIPYRPAGTELASQGPPEVRTRFP